MEKGLPILSKSFKKAFLTNEDCDKINEFMKSGRWNMELGDKTVFFVDGELHIHDTPSVFKGREWPPLLR